MLRAQTTTRGARGPIAAVLLVLALALVGCDAAPTVSGPAATAPLPTPAASPTPAVPTLTKVTLEPARAESAVLGTAGGVLEVTDAAGTRYRLEVPPGALWEETQIVAAPLNSIAGLPPEADVAAGIHLTPEGLVLRAAATLIIARRAPVERATLAFAYRGDLEDPFRYPAGRDSQSAVLRIAHFSGYGLLQATDTATTVEELGLAIPWQPPDGAADRALGEIAAVIDSSGADRTQAINEALRRWLDDGLAPLADDFGQMGTWDFDEFFELGVRLRSELALWDYVAALATLVGVTIDTVLETRITNLAVAVGSHAVQVANANCIASPPAVLALLRIPDIGGWLDWAEQRGISQRDDFLGAAFVAENLCVAVRFLPTDGVVFPESLQPGQTGSLALAVGLQVKGVAEVHATGRYEVKVVPTGTSPGGTALGSTDGVGRWSRDFTWAPGEAGLRLDIDACLPAPLGSVCDVETVTRGTTPSLAPTPPAAGSCPRYEVELNGVTHTGGEPDGVSATDDKGGGSALPTKTLLLNAHSGGSVTAAIVVSYTVDAAAAGSGPVEVTVAFYGRVRDEHGGKATVELKVGDVTRTFISRLTDVQGANVGPGVLEIPVSVTHGSVVDVSVVGTAESEGRVTMLSGGIQFLNRPEQVTFGHPGCS